MARRKTARRKIDWKFLDYARGTNPMFSGIEAAPYCTGLPSSGYVLYSRGRGGVWSALTEREWPPEQNMVPMRTSSGTYWQWAPGEQIRDSE